MPLQRLVGNSKIPQNEKIARASQEFEAVLLRQILEETQKPVFQSKFVEDTAVSGIYRDLVVNQLAENIAKSGTLGLARSLTKEFAHRAHSAQEAKLATAHNFTTHVSQNHAKP